MKMKFLAVLGLAAIAVVGACRSATNTNTVNTNATVVNTTTAPTAVPRTTESATVDPNMRTKIQDALNKKGFKNVTVEAMGGDAVLRGTYPKGKLAEVVATAQEAAGKPVKNEATEEK